MSGIGPGMPSQPPPDPNPSATGALDRRHFLQGAGALVAAAGLRASGQKPTLPASEPNGHNYVHLPPIQDVATEGPELTPGPFEPAGQRVGFAIVGLGRLSINQILPAFASTRLARPVALVSGSPEKARKLAAQYGIRDTSLYSYSTYDRLADNPEVQVIYIVLPNSLHAEYVVRGAKAGKHILCEKPFGTSVEQCEHMIAACAAAKVRLMVAYRQQYEPNNRALVSMVQAGKLGTLRSFLATNSQNQGDPTQWRLNLALAGGGCLPDVGIYCLNAARFLSNEEPVEVFGSTVRPPGDPRFREVEATCNFTLRFPSGLLAACSSGYAAHHSQMFRLEGSDAWAELSPAFGYHGLRLRSSRFTEGHETVSAPSIPDRDQFALEMDHMAECVLTGRQPHTPGEEGLQDQRLIEAIYASARSGKSVQVSPPAKPTRGPQPTGAA